MSLSRRQKKLECGKCTSVSNEEKEFGLGCWRFCVDQCNNLKSYNTLRDERKNTDHL